jgi:hypothetical protein
LCRASDWKNQLLISGRNLVASVRTITILRAGARAAGTVNHGGVFVRIDASAASSIMRRACSITTQPAAAAIRQALPVRSAS